MSDEPLVLGLDVGTSRTKVVLLDRAGVEVGHADAPTPFGLVGDGTEMTVDALRRGVAAVLERLGPARQRVVGVGIAGVAESGAPLDGAGRPLAPVIAWHDPRGEETVDLLQARFGPALASAIGQPLRPVSSVAKLGWMLAHGVGPVRRWLGVPELCLFQLTGAEATEHSLAARTGCYDVARGCYLPEVAEAIGLSVEVFPPVTPAGPAIGKVSTDGAAWSGLPAEAAVTLAGHDHLAGADGCGAGDQDLVNSVGTAETVIGRHRQLPDVERALTLKAAVTIRPGPDGWATLASAARSGIVLDRVAQVLGHPPAELDEMALDAEWVDVRAFVEGIQRDEGPVPVPAPPGAVWGGVLRVLADRTADACQRVSQLTGPPARLVVFGGGSRSRPWLAAKARASAVPVWRSTVAEAVARGAALRGGVAAGWWSSPGEAPATVLEPVGTDPLSPPTP